MWTEAAQGFDPETFSSLDGICGWNREYTRSGNLIYTQRRSDSLRSQVPSSKRCAQLDFALLEFGVGNDLWSFRLTCYFGMILVQAMKLAQPDLESMIHEKCLGPDQGAGGYLGDWLMLGELVACTSKEYQRCQRCRRSRPSVPSIHLQECFLAHGWTQQAQNCMQEGIHLMIFREIMWNQKPLANR